MIRVSIHWNQRRKVWAIQADEGEYEGKIIGHASQALLRSVTFKINEAARKRVIELGTEEAHAFSLGVLQTCWGFTPAFDNLPRIAARGADNGARIKAYTELRLANEMATTVHYEPGRWTCFVDAWEVPVVSAKALLLADRQRMIAEGAVTAPQVEALECESA